MNKVFKTALLFIAAATMTLGFTSCGNDDDPKVTPVSIDNEIKNLTSQYLKQVVYPTYSNLATKSETLYSQISALKAKLKAGTAVSQNEIDAICATYKDARKEWEESEAFLYGAASDFEIDPHIDTWPLDVPVLAKDLSNDAKIAKLDEEDGINYARKNLTPENLGFHGIEFIFFRDGKNRDVAIFNRDAIEDDENFKGLNVSGKEEVIFATAVAGDLRDKCYQLEVSWLGNEAPKAHIDRVAECAKQSDDFKTTVAKNNLSYGADLMASGTSNATRSTWKKVMETILVSGCSNICAEVADQKMGQAYRSATGAAVEKDDPNYIESPYSFNSYTDFYGNILSIKFSLYGNRNSNKWDAASIMAYLQKHSPEHATTLNTKLNAALAAIEACQNSGVPFVKNPGATTVGAAIKAVSDLDDTLNETSKWVLSN